MQRIFLDALCEMLGVDPDTVHDASIEWVDGSDGSMKGLVTLMMKPKLAPDFTVTVTKV